MIYRTTQTTSKKKPWFGIESAEQKMLDAAPVNIMTCDPQTFNIDYANATAVNTLNSLAHLLPRGISGDNIVGQNIDIFHKVPSHQRRLLSDPRNLPYKTVIRLGPEALELNVSAIYSGKSVSKLMLSWAVVTERENLRQMVDLMPINVMMCDPQEFRINFINETSKKTLKSIEHLLPVKAEQVPGSCIDIFHKVPAVQRKLLADPKNLPYSTVITLGTEKLELNVSAIIDSRGYYVGPMVSWSVITAQHKLAENVKEVTKQVSATATELQATAQSMSAAAEETSRQSASVAAASEEASSNVQTVAAATEELTNTIGTVSAQVKKSAEIAKQAVNNAQTANKAVESLNAVASKIGAVVDLISDIAAQTNLLALNATIEAARAGDAGKGFAVVASEVKSLASQTAKATEEIARQISEIQGETGHAVDSIKAITDIIGQIDDISGSVLQAITEQATATNEIAKNIQQAASGTAEVSHNIIGVQKAATETGAASHQTLDAAKGLAQMAVNLEGEVNRFINKDGAKKNEPQGAASGCPMSGNGAPAQGSLFQRLGGKEAVNAAVDKMYDKILQDPLLRPFFAGLDMGRLRRSQAAFMVMAFGGPHHYTGEDLGKAHAKLREKGLSDKHFDAVAGHLRSALVELGVPQAMIAEVMAIVSTTRGAVLGRSF